MSAYTNISRAYTFVTGTTIVAAEVNAELDQLVAASNTKIDKDGTSAFTANVSLVGSSPTNALHAASKGYVDTQDAAQLVDTALTGNTTIANISSCPSAKFAGAEIGTLTFSSTANKTIDFLTTVTATLTNSAGNLTFTAGTSRNLTITNPTSGYVVVSGFPAANPGPGRLWVDGGAANVIKVGT